MLRQLPDLLYNFGQSALDPQFLVTKNIWRRAEILSEYKSSLAMFDEYIVANGERPEDIAFKLYKNPFYNWVLLVINDITNYHEQWPKSTSQLQEYCADKYENPEATKDYITTEVKMGSNIIVPAGKVVPSNFSVSYFNGSVLVSANPVQSITNYQYEEELNSKKEKIQIVRPNFIEDFVAKYYYIVARGRKTQVGSTTSDISMG